ncbi:alpha-N-acetyl-neuraminyl-2,3-beta-galactosyl-1,3-N-acetyl-galactosaminide alpha-2,6-sialyltransferase isoform X4 [Polyodon spathula]|uniref:alpha-N-acetyl-neuraminyl-2,3-beta-galactosyl-1, 3-N-acetyl-galactosaminide alpha-2,6-sialyltransferase isoform X4 n=1 Tax=Polyodon spathula TaxID=7913 RepID=UPI001B7E7BF2|nr:alpha-N-acetyl-neuraminyl-2,3-beta-galactosyl-1,3-N-acetyl-galactosaminide alpha-2,6-sialyltransferase isoform X4 [Polyodon spathula]
MRTLRLLWIALGVVTTLAVFFSYQAVKPHIESGLHGYVCVSTGRPLDFHCKQCAFVSNSGQMLGARKGREIDQSDCVVRMNNAPTLGYEDDVGSKTSLRVVSHTSVPLLLRNETLFFRQAADTVYVVWGPERNMRQDGRGRIYNTLVRVTEKYPDTRIYMLTREKILECDRVFQNETGKDSRANLNTVPYHYYENGRLDECQMYRAHEKAATGGHRFITEKAIFAKWATRKNLTFSNPSWAESNPV